jgi:hypothetical protein
MVLKRDDSNGVVMLIPLSLYLYVVAPPPLLRPPRSYSHSCTHSISFCNPPCTPLYFLVTICRFKKKPLPSPEKLLPTSSLLCLAIIEY